MKKHLQSIFRISVALIPAFLGIGLSVADWILAAKNHIENAWAFAFAIVIICLVTIFYHICFFKHRKTIINAEMLTLKNETQIVKEYYSYLDSKIDEIEKLRHEMRNYIEVIKYSGMDNEEAFLLTQELDKKSEQIFDIKFSENKIINIIINQKAKEAEKHNIKFDCSVSIPKEISVDDYDLCSCIYNLLDNAVYANTLESNYNNRFIEFKAGVMSGYLIIKQKNTSLEPLSVDLNGNIITSKKDEGHGYGLRIIKDICSKYNGYCEFSQNDGIFYSTIGLLLEKTP